MAYIIEPGGPGSDTTALHDDAGGEIAAIDEKTTLVGADLVAIEDSEDSNNKKRVQVNNLPGGTDADAIHDNVAGEIVAISEKASPVSADVMVIEDSEATNAKKRVQLGNLPGGGGRQVLWEWNGTDVSQFTLDSSTGSPTGTLSAGTLTSPGFDVPSGNVIIYTTGGASSSLSLFLINDLPSLPERYTVRCRCGQRVSASPGIAVMAQDVTHWAGSFVLSAQNLNAMIGNNVDPYYTANHNSGTILAVPLSGVLIDFDVVAREPSTGVDPQYSLRLFTALGGLEIPGKGGPWNTSGAPPALWDSSWQTGGTIRQVGIAADDINAGAELWWSEFQVLAYPEDS